MVIEFDSKYLPDVKVGDTFVYSIDGKPEKQKVKITKIYPTIDENTRKVSAEALLPANSLLVPVYSGMALSSRELSCISLRSKGPSRL